MHSTLSIHARNLDSYRQLERTHKRCQKLRSLFELSVEDSAFFIGRGDSHTPATMERQARTYFAILLDNEELERTNDQLRAERLREGLSLGEAAFLLVGIEDIEPFPNQLRTARLRTGLSQEEVAYLIGKPRSLLSRYELGKCEPDLETAMSLSSLYDRPLEKLFLQRVGALNRRLKKRERIFAVWRRTRQRSPASSAA